MRKLYFFFFALLFVCSSKAQTVNNYVFTALSGTYVPLVGGTSVPGVLADDANSATTIPIGFSFNYGGVPFTSVTANSNGWLSFNASPTTSTFDMRNNNFAVTVPGLHPLLAPVWDDLDGRNSVAPTPAASYLTTGAAGARIFTFEWLNFAPFAATAANISFQVKLYEATGVIEFHYRQEPSSTANFSSASAGISSSPTDFISLGSFGTSPTTSTTTSSNTLTTRPASGQIYRFTPPVPCNGTPTGGTTVANPGTGCYGTNVTLSTTGSTSGVSGISYQWQYAPIASSSWTDITGANAPSFSFTPPGSFQYRAKITCSSSGLFDYSTTLVVSISNLPTYASFPYTQDFETWINGCSTTDRPGVNWGGSPSTGNNSWRREDQGSSASWSSTSGAYSPLFTTGAHSARFHSFNAASGSQGTMDLFIDMSTDPAPTKFLKFDYINTSGTDVLKVFVSTDGGFSFTQSGANLGVQTPWASKEFAINSVSANTVIRLQATSDFGATDIGVDNLSIALGCNGTPVAGTAVATPASICYGGNTTLSLTGNTNAPGIGYQWQSSPNGTTWTNITGATASTLVVNNAALQYRAVVTCANGGAFSNSTPVIISVTLPTYASIPYFQGFESWINGCATTDRPDASWGLIPVTSDSAWRREDQGTSASWSSTAGGYSPVSTQALHSARFHTFNTTSGRKGIMDLFVNLSTSTQPKQLKFDYINTTGSDSLVVLLSEDGGATFTRLDSLRIRTAWFTKVININSNAATAVIRFRATSDFGTTDIGVDNLFILTACNGLPAPGTIAVTSGTNSICAGNSASLGVSGQTQGPGITYQWQSSVDNSTWTNIASATNPFVTVTPAANTYYRVRVICSNTADTANSASLQLTVNNPQVLTTTPVTRCGPGTVPLFATASAGATLSWYAAATGGSPIGTGTTFTTPIISSNTNFYVSANIGGTTGSLGPVSPAIGTFGTSFTGSYEIFDVTTPVRLNTVDVFATAAGTVTVELLNSAGAVLQTSPIYTVTAAQANSTTTVVGTPITVPVGFDITPGTGYRLNFKTGSTATLIRNSAGATATYGPVLGVTITGNSNATVGFYYNFYNWSLGSGCESPRTAVLASISAAPAFTVTPTTTICNNAIKALTVTSTLANFDRYTWAPATGLFTDAAATVPYTAGANVSTVYVKTATAGTYTYIATANNTSTSCQNIDSTKITVLPGTVTINSVDQTLCVSGTSTLNLNPSTGYTGASIQWFISTNGGTSYTAITGATGVSYTTPVITATTMYKAEIKDAAGNNCLQPTITVNVNNPQVLTSTPAARCGPGTLTLQATTAAGNTLNWYANATGGPIIATGNSYTTPSLSATTTYYVAAFQTSGTGTAGRVAPLPASTGSAGDASGLVFTVTKAFTLTSVDIYSSSTGGGSVTVELTSAAGTVLQTAGPFVIPPRTGATVGSTPPATPTTLNLGFNIQPGTGYRLRTLNHTGAILRDNPIAPDFSYPIAIGSVGSITSGLLLGSTSATQYLYFYNWQFTTGCESPRTAVVAQVSSNTAITSQPANIATCAGNTVTFSVTATGATLTYQWRKGTTPIAGATGSSYTINGVAVADAGDYNVVITGLCGNVTSANATLTVAAANTWLGAASTDWNNPANWCGGVPTSISDIIIGSGTPFQPNLNAVGNVHNITINAGASLTLTAAGFLNVFGDFDNSGTFSGTAGVVAFKGTANQNVGSMTAGTVLINGSGITLTGNMNVSSNLILTNGNITLGTNNLVLNNSVTGSASSHVVTNGTGGVISNNITTSSVTVPVGPNATSYNPVIISNGQGRNYTVKVAAGINPTINNPSRAINRTWDVRSSSAVSDVNILLQYSDGDVNASATGTSVMEVGIHNGTSWNVVSPGIGVTPSGLSDARQVGITTSQFGPMVVANFGGITFPTAIAGIDPDVAGIVLMPNPVQTQTLMRVQLRRAMKVYWTVVDANGRIVMSFSKQLTAGSNDIPLQVGHLAQGVYQVIGATEKGKTQLVRFVKL